jgi:hypothetical protein
MLLSWIQAWIVLWLIEEDYEEQKLYFKQWQIAAFVIPLWKVKFACKTLPM